MGMQNFLPPVPVPRPDHRRVWNGSLFLDRSDELIQTIVVRSAERPFLAQIFLTMLSGQGGDFDEDDTVFADIYMIDGQRLDVQSTQQGTQVGGVWNGHNNHFGNKGAAENQTISVYAGPIKHDIAFRLRVVGDSWAGASFILIEL